MTRINPSELRIIIDKKEIYPSREILPRLEKDCVINIRTRLLGGGHGGKRWQKRIMMNEEDQKYYNRSRKQARSK